MFEGLKSLALLRRIDKKVERIAVALERIATATERGDSTGTVFRSNYNDPVGTPAVLSQNDELLAEIMLREAKLGRTLDEEELAEVFSGQAQPESPADGN